MYINIDLNEFIEAFRNAGRDDSFSYEGFKALFEYLEDYEESSDARVELDVIGIDCDFVEYQDLESFHEEYDKEDYPDLETLKDYTTVIKVGEEGFIIQYF